MAGDDKSTEDTKQAARLDAVAWRDMIANLGDDEGFWEPLGSRHAAFFADAGQKVLLVTFEDGHAIRETAPDQLPEGLRLARLFGWSCLTILAEGETWWRDPAVFRFFDRQVDDAFFEDFDRVVFFGAGPSGYAAAAFSVAAPGANVLLLAPRATMDARAREWDTRHPIARQLDFTGRYAYAPDMTEGAGHTFVIYDPIEMADAMHAALFLRPWTTLLRMRRMGGKPQIALRRMGILDEVVQAAGEDRLNTAEFSRLMRVRRNYGPYLRRLLNTNTHAKKTLREALICRSVARRLRVPAFISRLAELERQSPGISGVSAGTQSG